MVRVSQRILTSAAIVATEHFLIQVTLQIERLTHLSHSEVPLNRLQKFSAV